MQKAKMGWECR